MTNQNGTPKSETVIKQLDRVSYITINENKVTIYNKQDGGFIIKTYQDAQLAEAVSAILFPEDVDIFNGKVILSGISQVDNIDSSINVQRSVDSKPFYRPFYLVAGKQQVEQNSLGFVFSYDINEKFMSGIDINGSLFTIR